ncbi:MAG: DUF5011 domain-containing protein, partial [Bacilli bacterium]
MKKNNMGFTLIELLSVIALLGVLAFVIIPNIESILKNSKGSLYDKQIDLIETAAKLWSSDEKYKILLEKNESWPYVITLSDLQYFNFIEKDINNPKTKTPFSENTLILITKSNGKYVFNVEETTDDHLSPIITLNGDKDIQVEINSLYTELGATVKKNNVDVIVTTKIQENGVVVSSIDNSKVGSYMIIYTAIFTDENNIVHTGMAFRRIKFVDTTPPVITCSSCKNLTIIESDANYVFPEVTVTDNSGEKIKAKIIGSFSSIIPGEKKIIYQAIDSSSNVTNYEVFFLVKDTIQPELTFSTSYIVNNDSIEYVAYASDSGSGIKDYSFDGGNTWQKSNKAVKRCDSTVILMTRDNALNVTSITSSEKCIPQFVYNYTGNYQTFVAPYTGWYKIELWGAGGG